MNERVAQVLEEYAAREAEERKAIFSFDNDIYLGQRETMLLGIGPHAGQWMNLLIRTRKPRHIVEVGTAFGYSTLWLAEAAAAVGAVVTTYEVVPEKQRYAAEMIRKAGLGDAVRFVVGDALEGLRQNVETIDFALIDAWKELYIPAFDLIYPHLAPGSIVCADNMLFPDYQLEAAATYIAHVRAAPAMQTVTIPLGSGVEFSVHTGG